MADLHQKLSLRRKVSIVTGLLNLIMYIVFQLNSANKLNDHTKTYVNNRAPLQGISGSKPAASNPLEKMLTMIPPPPAKASDHEDPDNSNSDWED